MLLTLAAAVLCLVLGLVMEALGGLESEILSKVAVALQPTRQQLDYEHTGGAHLLGVGGVVVIAHGASSRIAIANALRQARDGINRDLVGKVTARLASR